MSLLKRYFLLILFFTVFISISTISSQNDIKSLSILAIPYVSDGQDIRTILQMDGIVRIAITKTKEFLIENGFKTMDFEAKLKKAKEDGRFKGIDNERTAKLKFLEDADSDIHMEVEVKFLPTPTGNSVRLLINAYQTATSISLATLVCTSNKFNSDDVGRLTIRALRECKEEMMESLNRGFQDIKTNGQAIQVHFTIADTSPLNFNTEFEDSKEPSEIAPLKDLIEMWISEHEDINYYGDIRSADKNIIYGEIRINFMDQKGHKLQPSKIMLKLRSYLRKLKNNDDSSDKLNIKEDIINGTYYIRIDNK